MPSLLNNLNFLGLSASAKILLTPSVGKYVKLLALADISKSVVDIGLADANVQRRLNATVKGQQFLAVWPFVSAGLDLATLTSEQILGFIQTRNTAATILRQEGQLEAADRLEQMEDFVNGAVNIITTATKAITKQRLPNSFVEALKKFGKTEDDILEYFTKYHNERSGQKFLNEIEDFITSINSHNLTRDEAFALWGYTTNFFYRDLNAWLRNGENTLKTNDLKSLINSGLVKLPNYSGQNVYRGIAIDANKLQDFLNSYKTGTNHIWNDFTSCGGSQAASFGGRPDVNIIFEIQHTTGKEISDLADGIRYGTMPKPEILIKAGSKFQTVVDPIYDTILGKWKVKLIQIL